MRPSWLLAPPLCAACRLPVRSGDALCAPCRRELAHLGAARAVLAGVTVWAPVAYEGPARAVVRRLKFNGAVALAEHMAAAIAANAPPGLLEHPLAPVPSPSARVRLRGFCHAALLAAALARRTGLPVVRPLERRDGSRRQLGRPRADRLRSPPAFRAASGEGAAVVLVDDVVTTGATLAACAGALREAGWACADAVAYARTPVR